MPDKAFGDGPVGFSVSTDQIIQTSEITPLRVDGGRIWLTGDEGFNVLENVPVSKSLNDAYLILDPGKRHRGL